MTSPSDDLHKDLSRAWFEPFPTYHRRLVRWDNSLKSDIRKAFSELRDPDVTLEDKAAVASRMSSYFIKLQMVQNQLSWSESMIETIEGIELQIERIEGKGVESDPSIP